MGTPYETDIVAWAIEQAALLRSGHLSDIDALHIAEEIESVASSERRELKNDLAVLIAHLLKWKFQASRRSKSWHTTIKVQREEISDALEEIPSLRHCFNDEKWLRSVWRAARSLVLTKTQGRIFPSRGFGRSTRCSTRRSGRTRHSGGGTRQGDKLLLWFSLAFGKT
jgi:hypothetical protein